MVRVVASDLDGTLLRPDLTISARTRAAIRRARRAGIALVAVTGRPPRSVRHLAAGVGLEGIAICANGALVYDLDRDLVLDETLLAAEVARALVTRLRAAAPGVAFAWEDRAGFGREPGWVRVPVLPVEGTAVGDPVELVTAPLAKLLAWHPGLDFDELAERAAAAAGEEAVVTWSNRELIEVSAAGVTKAYGLGRVCARLGVDRREVVAVGDMPNDLTMLAWAGRGVAVANADPRVLAAAAEVTAANVDDGVAQLLERLVEAEVPAGPQAEATAPAEAAP